MSKLGSVEFIEGLVKMIALRQGFGDVLARGLAQAAGALGGQAPSLIKHPDPYEPRLYLTTALLWALEPREPIQALHEIGYPLAQWTTGVKGTRQDPYHQRRGSGHRQTVLGQRGCRRFHHRRRASLWPPG